MARFCVCLASASGHPGARPGAADAHLAAMGAPALAPGLALVRDEPGHAQGPFDAHGMRAVGEVTLHNRAELRAALAADGAPAPSGCGDGELLLRCWARLGERG
ncbi:asparagine synthetase B family protein, partial [Streptomyces sp. NPDC002920]